MRGAEIEAMRESVDLAERNRRAVAEGLASVLADTHTLYFKTHAFRWNVTGPLFYALHAHFEQQYEELWRAADPIADLLTGHVSAHERAAWMLRSVAVDEGTGAARAT